MDLNLLADLTPVLPPRARLLTQEEGRQLGDVIVTALPWLYDAQVVGLLDEDTSNFPCLATAGPLQGYVLHISHDHGPTVLARSLQGFVDHARQAWSAEQDLGQQHELGDERTPADERAAIWLLDVCEVDDLDAESGRAMAMQLIGEGWPEHLLTILADDEESFLVREAAAERLAEIGDPRALPALRNLSHRGGDMQDAEAARRAIASIERRNPR